MLEAVLFDWGETLMTQDWDQEIALGGVRAGLAALTADRLPTPEAISEWFDERADEHVLSDDELDLAAVMCECFADLGCSLADDDVRLYLKESQGAWEEGYRLASAAHALLEALRARGLRLALVSNTASPGWLLHPVLERQGLVERLDAIVLSSEVGKRKPHPAIFERALAELGVEAGRALFVGDRLREDVGGAGALGMRTVQAVWFRADESPGRREPDFQAFTEMDVLNVVRRFNGEHRPAPMP